MRFRDELIGITIAFFIFNGAGNAKDIIAKGDVNFESGLFGSEPSEEIKQKAISNAVVNAWERYTADFDIAGFSVYKHAKGYFESHPDEFIVDQQIVEASNNSETNTYSVVVRVSFRDNAIAAKLAESNPQTGHVGGVGGKSLISFLFVARKQSNVKVFDARVTSKSSVKQEQDKSENTNITESGGQVKTSDEVTDTLVTGGNTTYQEDQISYSVFTSRDTEILIENILSSYNFEIVTFSDCTSRYHGPSIAEIKKEFATSDELSPGIRLAAIKATKACNVNIRYFATGELNVRKSDVDPATGLKRTSVVFRGQVWDITSGLPRVVASTEPIQKEGLGIDATSATTDALTRAASEGAAELVNQLNSRMIR